MAETIKLTVDTGSVQIDVVNERGNKIGEFEFNPTDSNILNRFENVIDFFNGVKFGKEISDSDKADEIKKLSKAIEDQFDYLLGYKVSEGLFKKCGALTVIKNGDFYFENVIESLGSLIENQTKQRVEKKLKKIRKYTDKYQK